MSPTPREDGTDERPVGDEEIVEQTVRDYLEALALDQAPGKIALSTGDVRTLAEWRLEVSLSFGESLGVVEIENLQVGEIGPEGATVDLAAELRVFGFEDDPPTVLTGPVSLERTDDGWAISDYLVDGRSIDQSVHTRVEGIDDQAGVTVEMEGAYIGANEMLVLISAINGTESSYQLLPATIVAPGGQEHGFGEPSATQRSVLPSAPLETYVYWSGRTLPAEADSFRLLLDFEETGGNSILGFDIPVSLGP